MVMSDDFGREYSPAELLIARIFDRLETKIREIIMTSAEDQTKDVTAQLVKAKGEIDAMRDSLESAAVSQETLDALKAASQAIDDENPDQPATP